MGFRNPFRITVDPETELGPDGRLRPGRRRDEPEPRPAGQRRVQRDRRAPATTAGPTASATTSPYNDYDFATGPSGPKFNCAAPVNNSPNNTGLTNLPPAQPGRRRGRATPRPTRGSRSSAPAAPRWAARATTTTRATRRRPSSRRTTTASGSSASGTTAGSRPRRSTATGNVVDVDPFPTSVGRCRTTSASRLLQAPDGHGVRARRLALPDRVGLAASAATTPTRASTGSTTSAGDRRPIAHGDARRRTPARRR